MQFQSPDAATLSQLPFAAPRAAYIHVPFCRHRCGYCNFPLIAGRDDLIGDFLRAIELELATLVEPREVDTLYFGGGTPTHLSAERVWQLAEAVLQWHPLAMQGDPSSGPSQNRRGNIEWTVEANPSDVDSTMIQTLAELGVTRVSLGAQSLRSETLRLLERDHQAADVDRAVELARSAGMRVSLDLIFATPGQTLNQWRDDVDAALALKPDHISTYGLTFEQGTPFWNRRHRGELIEADEELQRAMYGLAIDRLTASGFDHYEVSNFARPDCRSRHNETYWFGDGYYAAGPGAARYVDGIRETNHRSVTTYLERVLAGKSPVAEREQLDPEARARELLVFSLRRLEGVHHVQFANRTGYSIEGLIAEPLEKFTALALLADDGERLRLTREGLFVSDAIWPELL